MRTRSIATLLAGTAVLAAAGAARSDEPSYVARFLDRTETGFVVEAIADVDAIGPYAICKAVWLADKSGSYDQIALTHPEWIEPQAPAGMTVDFPPDWVALRTQAFLAEPFPSDVMTFDMTQWIGDCRSIWAWYR